MIKIENNNTIKSAENDFNRQDLTSLGNAIKNLHNTSDLEDEVSSKFDDSSSKYDSSSSKHDESTNDDNSSKSDEKPHYKCNVAFKPYGTPFMSDYLETPCSSSDEEPTDTASETEDVDPTKAAWTLPGLPGSFIAGFVSSHPRCGRQAALKEMMSVVSEMSMEPWIHWTPEQKTNQEEEE